MKKFPYKNIFSYGSLQFSGNLEEYLSKNTEKLVMYIVNPRVKNKFNLIRLYIKGKLVKEVKVPSSENIFLYYFLWYFFHWYILMSYFSSAEKFIVFGGHPLCFFGMKIQKLFRNVLFAYWIGDYFPGGSFAIQNFERVKMYVHKKVDYACYLSDDINKIFNNGKIINTRERKTVMWGVKPKKIKRNILGKKFAILFIGLIKDSQGLEFLFTFLKNHTSYFLNIIGVCEHSLYKKYQLIIIKNDLQKRVFFPNRFFSDEEINELSRNNNIGIALYNVDRSNPTYYTDPGKVKAYMELGLPVIMSNVSAVVPYIRKFKAGEVISRDIAEAEKALITMKKTYARYKKGVDLFNKYFYFENYYKKKLVFLTSI